MYSDLDTSCSLYCYICQKYYRTKKALRRHQQSKECAYKREINSLRRKIVALKQALMIQLYYRQIDMDIDYLINNYPYVDNDERTWNVA